MTENVTAKNFKEKVLESDKPVVLKWYTPDCRPCALLVPMFEKVARENPQYYFYQINAEDEWKLTQEYGVLSVPTFSLFKKGIVTMEITGMVGEDKMKNMLGGV